MLETFKILALVGFRPIAGCNLVVHRRDAYVLHAQRSGSLSLGLAQGGGSAQGTQRGSADGTRRGSAYRTGGGSAYRTGLLAASGSSLAARSQR